MTAAVRDRHGVAAAVHAVRPTDEVATSEREAAANGEPTGAAAEPAADSERRRPHLVAVPDCEPPLEPLPPDPDSAPPGPDRISFAPLPTSAARPYLRSVDPDRAPALPARGGAAPTAAGAPRRATPLSWQAVTITHRRCAPAGSLPRAAAIPIARRPVIRPHRIHPLIVTSTGIPDWSTDGQMGIRPTPSAELPTALDAGTALARGLLEALSGRRTLAQLRTHCAPDVFAGLLRLESLHDPRLQLLSVRACEPADGVAEISAVFRCGTRTRALALRLEGIDGRWRVTVLHLG